MRTAPIRGLSSGYHGMLIMIVIRGWWRPNHARRIQTHWDVLMFAYNRCMLNIAWNPSTSVMKRNMRNRETNSLGEQCRYEQNDFFFSSCSGVQMRILYFTLTVWNPLTSSQDKKILEMVKSCEKKNTSLCSQPEEGLKFQGADLCVTGRRDHRANDNADNEQNDHSGRQCPNYSPSVWLREFSEYFWS